MQTENATGTAVAIVDAPTDQEIEQLRKRGASVVAHRKELAKLEKQIAGLTWGSGTMMVKGSSFSDMTRGVIAEFCAITRANPLYHIFILGDRPYLNAEYWSDLINTQPAFHHYEQRDLSPSVEKALRERAARHREVAAELEGPEKAQRTAKALDLEEEADDVALARATWSAPDWAVVVVQTTIWKFIDATPLDAIRRGEVTDFQRYLVQVPECNWAGNKPRAKTRDGREYDPDPIGNNDPAKSARTRSLRRAAVKAFSAWMQPYERQIAKAEQAIEAEFEIIREDRARDRAQLPTGNGQQAVRTGNGEPSAANANGAKPLPVEGDKPAEPKQAEPAAPAFDRADARKALFATLTVAGVDVSTEDKRHAWAVSIGNPASTKEWNKPHFDHAQTTLRAPAIGKLDAGAKLLGQESDALAHGYFQRTVAELQLREINELNARISAELDAADSKTSSQTSAL